MSLLRRIQDATFAPNVKLANILRMSKILAARLDRQGFKEWIEQELDGYKDRKQLPGYRILRNMSCHGNFYGSFGSGYKTNSSRVSIRGIKRSSINSIYYFQRQWIREYC